MIMRKRSTSSNAALECAFESAADEIMRPQPHETEEQRYVRLQEQQEAVRISREIDDGILEHKKALDKRKRAIKILLLGQAESGKSTTLKNFQLNLAPNQWYQERKAWKIVIQLNLIMNVKMLLDILNDELAQSQRPAVYGAAPSLLTDNHKRIRMRLSPLTQIETALTRQFALDESETAANRNHRPSQDFFVRANSRWKAVVSGQRSHESQYGPQSPRDDPTGLLEACQNDILELWDDNAFREMLRRKQIRLEDKPGFFLNDVERIANPNYDPTNDDILRARLRTIGVEEHKFYLENDVKGGGAAMSSGTELFIYDVGGAKSHRKYWVPYFDDMNAIIFLAPLSGFNQFLDEDRRVNRLEDTLQLWQDVCSNQLLTRTNFILFLNKMDLLRRKLEAGIRLDDFVSSYRGQPNDVEHVTSYLRARFRAYHKKLSLKARICFCHETSVIDSRATAAVLAGVKEGILRTHLTKAAVI